MRIRNFGSIAVCLCVAFITVSSHPNRSRSRGGNNRRNPCNPSERFHQETGQCYPVGMKGPCGDNMIFVEDKATKSQGVCECDDQVGCDFWPFTYWEPNKQCYPLFAQGPCKDGEWLVNHEESRRHHPRGNSPGKMIRGVCKRRVCDPMNIPGKTFSHEDKCYEVGTQAFCTTPQEQAYFTRGSGVPNCFSKPVTTQVCQTARQGGGTIQQVVIITPSPVSPIPPPPPPTLSEMMSPASSPALENFPPVSPPTSVTFAPILPPDLGNATLPFRKLNLGTKTLSNAGQIPCAGGKARSSSGDCSPRADFS